MGTATISVHSCLGSMAYGKRVPGGVLLAEGTITGSDSYATGGDALTVTAINTALAAAGFDATASAIVEATVGLGSNDTHFGRLTDAKIKVTVGSTGAETASAVDLSAVTFPVSLVLTKVQT